MSSWNSIILLKGDSSRRDVRAEVRSSVLRVILLVPHFTKILQFDSERAALAIRRIKMMQLLSCGNRATISQGERFVLARVAFELL